MLAALFLLWLAAFPLMGSPGPATMSLAAVGAAFGARRGLSYLLGVVVGTTAVLFLVATGITALVLSHPLLATAITVLGAAYILYLAYKIATAPVVNKDGSQSRPPSFYGGFILAIANPKAFAAIGAVYSSHRLLPYDVMIDGIAKIGALSLVIVVVNSAWLLFGAVLSSLLRHPKGGRIANIGFAAMLVASVGLALAVQ